MEFENKTFSDDVVLESDQPPYEKLENETPDINFQNKGKSGDFVWKKLFLANFLTSFILILAAIFPTAFLLKYYIDGKIPGNSENMDATLQGLVSKDTLNDIRIRNLQNLLEELNRNVSNTESKILMDMDNMFNTNDQSLSRLGDMTQCLACQTEVPTWPKDTYIANIREDAPLGTPVATLTPSTCSGITESIEYTLYASRNFTINKDTGLISSTGALDRETVPEYRYNLSAASTCSGIKRSSKNTTLIIMIDDVNDNYPVFGIKGYEASLYLLARIGTSVVNVTATDKDIGINGQIHYSINPINMPFDISATGEITTNRQLPADSEVIEFNVVATDGGLPPKSTSVGVHISLYS